MVISLIDNSGTRIKKSIDSSNITIGRGSSCEVKFISEFFSRQHLEIKIKEGKIFIKDLTLTNWVLLNDRALPKGEFVEYSAENKLELPGDVKVVIEDRLSDSHKESLEDLSLDINEPKKKKVHKYTTSVRSKYKKIAIPKKEESNFFAILLVVLAIGYVAYSEYNREEKMTKNAAKTTPSVEIDLGD